MKFPEQQFSTKQLSLIVNYLNERIAFCKRAHHEYTSLEKFKHVLHITILGRRVLKQKKIVVMKQKQSDKILAKRVAAAEDNFQYDWQKRKDLK